MLTGQPIIEFNEMNWKQFHENNTYGLETFSKTNLKIFKSKTYYEKLPKKFYKLDYDYIINFRSYLILDKKI